MSIYVPTNSWLKAAFYPQYKLKKDKDAKGVIGNRKSTKDRQTKRKRTEHDLQNTTQKNKNYESH